MGAKGDRAGSYFTVERQVKRGEFRVKLLLTNAGLENIIKSYVFVSNFFPLILGDVIYRDSLFYSYTYFVQVRMRFEISGRSNFPAVSQKNMSPQKFSEG